MPFVRQLPNLERLHDKLTLQKANTQYLSYGGQPSTIATLQEHGFAIYFRPLFSNLTTARRHHPKNGIVLNMCGNSDKKGNTIARDMHGGGFVSLVWFSLRVQQS